MRRLMADVAERLDRVAAEIAAGRHEAGTRLFMETIVGAGTWDMLPEQARRACTYNAPTFLDQFHDPDSETIDLEDVARIAVPVQVTEGGLGPPELRAHLGRLAAALPQVERYTFTDAGHLPHRTHPEELARVVGDFLARSTAGDPQGT